MATEERILIRCSSLPRALKCPASMVAPDIEIEGDRTVALIGRAAHGALAAYVKDEDPNFDAIAREHKVEPKSFIPLYHVGRRIWEQYRNGLEVLAVEREMKREILPGVDLKGSPDLIARAIPEPVTTIVPWDWKSGALADHRDQLIGYAWLATREWPAEHVKGVLCWLRDEIADIDDISMAEVEDLPARIRDALDHPGRYCPGSEQCRFCPRRYDCPARTALVRQSIEGLIEASRASKTLGLIAIEPRALAALWPKVKMVKAAVAQYDEVIHARVEEAGSLPVGDGTELCLLDVERKKIDAVKGLPVLMERFGGLEAVMPAIGLGNSEVWDLASAGAPRGRKREAVEDLVKALEAADALKTTHGKRLGTRKEGKGHGTERAE